MLGGEGLWAFSEKPYSLKDRVTRFIQQCIVHTQAAGSVHVCGYARQFGTRVGTLMDFDGQSVNLDTSVMTRL